MGSRLEPEAEISPLPNADGSVAFSYAGYKVTASVNGPIETVKRDEYAFEAFVDVVSALRQLIPIRNFPRCLIQITLQVTGIPENEYANGKVTQYNMNLPIIPALLHAAILALLSGAMPLKGIATAALVIVPEATSDEKTIVDPTPVQISRARSVHVLAFTSEGDLLLSESEGQFSLADWDEVVGAARQVCFRSQDDMDTDEKAGVARPADMKQFIRTAMASKVAADLHWRIPS
ncbi:related to RRP46 protein, involved in rRNA processing [Cephalotrichum gorgonifer]|uniref:Related to RRP46 protein, involved in rRNA processing n=1 Tax=Cephalotrichum gorgonifer TaxID=2041049 RepID=A0AAE8MQD8_9PEZI|nr:related to RRP46 protein, involved in rRNA processing [Cephalotrichum gorgonifer]